MQLNISLIVLFYLPIEFLLNGILIKILKISLIGMTLWCSDRPKRFGDVAWQSGDEASAVALPRVGHSESGAK